MSISVLFVSLVSSASNAHVVSCIAFRFYNMSSHYVYLKDSADSFSGCLLTHKILLNIAGLVSRTPGLCMNICKFAP